jgi:Xaa-Pro aminopeptidase
MSPATPRRSPKSTRTVVRNTFRGVVPVQDQGKGRMVTQQRFNMKRLTQGMEKARVDAVVASSPWNVTYTSGVYFEASDPITFLVTTRDAKQGLVVNEADAIYMRNASKIDDIRPFTFDVDSTTTNLSAVRLLADMLKDYGLAKGLIGFEKTFSGCLYYEALVHDLPTVRASDGSPIFSETRAIKTPTEIEILRNAAYSTDKAIYAAFALARAGDTEKDMATQMQSNALRFGAHTFAHTVLSAGEKSTIVHAYPQPKAVKRGEVVHVDFGAIFDGYCSDISRNAIVGQPKSAQETIYARLLEIEERIINYLRPGVVTKDVFALSDNLFKKVGLEYPWGTLGHSIGLQVHEVFEITRTSDRVLEPSMVIMIEPTHVEPGDARYHIEDCVLITEEGHEILSNFSDRGRMFQIS